jgi:hypothetical protein
VVKYILQPLVLPVELQDLNGFVTEVVAKNIKREH